MRGLAISDKEFDLFRNMLYQVAGIHLSPAKKTLVCGRLSRRLEHYQLQNYEQYFSLITAKEQSHELQTAVDLLTTNETYFFREPKHFSILQEKILPAVCQKNTVLRIWSAACSSGEEPYSIAMLLADQLAEHPWEVLASDISSKMLQRAKTGHYAMDRAKHIPKHYLHRFCLKGIGAQEGSFLVDKTLRSKITFRQINLNSALDVKDNMDVIFLRNVMIYFDLETKQKVISRLAEKLNKGGYLIIGHSETLQGIRTGLSQISPSVYRLEASG